MSIRQENRKKNIRALLITIAAVIVLAAVGIAIVAAQNSSAFKERGEGYYYSSGEDGVYSKVGTGFAVASTSELQVFGADGVQTMHETYIMSDPAMSSGGSNAVLYDIGGTSVKLFNADGMIQSIKTEGTVISAKVSRKGYTAVCCEETGYQGAVYVYNDVGSLVFKWLSGDGYVLSACVSDDSEYLAVLTLNTEGTRVVKLRLKEEGYKKEYTVSDVILMDAAFSENGSIYAISDEALYCVRDDKLSEIYSFGEKNLADYSLGNNQVLVLNEHKSGGKCRVISISDDDEITEVASFENGIISMDAEKKHIAVLTDTELCIYNTKDYELTANYEVSACLKVLVYEDGSIVAASRHSAAVYSAKGSETGRKGK